MSTSFLRWPPHGRPEPAVITLKPAAVVAENRIEAAAPGYAAVVSTEEAMRTVCALVTAMLLLAGCGGASGPAAGAAAALPAYTPMYYPVSLGASYVIPTGRFRDTVRYELSYVYPLDISRELFAAAGYLMYTWDNGVTKSGAFPVLVGVRYRQEMLSGASWYAGAGIGWSFNDTGDMKGSLLGRFAIGLEQPVSMQGLNMLMRLEAAYDSTKADAEWGPWSQHDLSNIAIGLQLVLLL